MGAGGRFVLERSRGERLRRVEADFGREKMPLLAWSWGEGGEGSLGGVSLLLSFGVGGGLNAI